MMIFVIEVKYFANMCSTSAKYITDFLCDIIKLPATMFLYIQYSNLLRHVSTKLSFCKLVEITMIGILSDVSLSTYS